MKGRVLIIAGSDSCGGAGIQADIKTVTALGAYAMTAVTALTAQDTRGVSAIHGAPPEFAAKQMRMALCDIGADCLKTGMLHSARVIDAVVQVLQDLGQGLPLVVDPVMIAKGGQALLEPLAVRALRQRLIPLAHVLTPNVPEAEALSGVKINDQDDARQALAKLASMGPGAVLLKGGHLPGEAIVDLLFHEGKTEAFESERINTVHTHGTGCTLASAIAASLAQGMGIRDAVGRARRYVQEAIRTAPGFGKGHGPINHAHTARPFD